MERNRADVDRLIAENQNLVRDTARRFLQTSAHNQDMLQCGLIGLWKAATKWKENGEFKHYARRSILNNMKKLYQRRKAAKNAETKSKKAEEAAEAVDYEDDTIDHIDLVRRINSAWPPNSRERYVLIALSNGVSKQAIAVALGIEKQTVQKIAVRAYARIKEDG